MIRRVALAGIVAALVAAPASAGLESAMSAFKAQNFLESAAEFQTLVEESPRYDFGWFMLGHSLLKMRRPSDAEPMFRRAVHLAPENAEYYQGLALALKDEGKFPAAIEVLDAAEAHARDPRAIFALHALRGFLYVQIGSWSAAAADLETTRRIKPDPSTLDMLGQAYLGIGDIDEAAGALRQALGLDPARPDTLRLLAEVVLLQGQQVADPARKKALYAEAFDRASRYVRMRPETSEALNLLGRAALGAGRLDEAQTAFERVLAAEPRQCYVMVNLARVRVARGAWAGAEAMLRRAAACAPRLGAVFETLGAVYMRQERWADAAAAFGRAEQLQSTPYSRAGLAEAARRLGNDVRPANGPPSGSR